MSEKKVEFEECVFTFDEGDEVIWEGFAELLRRQMVPLGGEVTREGPKIIVLNGQFRVSDVKDVEAIPLPIPMRAPPGVPEFDDDADEGIDISIQTSYEPVQQVCSRCRTFVKLVSPETPRGHVYCKKCSENPLT